MKKTFVSLIAIFVVMVSHAQNEITLTASAEGSTKEEAVHNALRSALEQTYGTFISSNTTILNDEIVKDEIVSISSGTVSSYEEISNTILNNGNCFVTIKAVLSLLGLKSFAQSKGAAIEFAGATLAHKSMLIDLNKNNEIIVVRNLLTQLVQLPKLCDYKLEMTEPRWSEWDNAYTLTLTVLPLVNDNLIACHNLIHSTLSQLSLSKKAIDEYRSLGHSVGYINWSGQSYCLRNRWMKSLPDIFYCILKHDFESYIVKNGTTYSSSHIKWEISPRLGWGDLSVNGRMMSGCEGYYSSKKGVQFKKEFGNKELSPLGYAILDIAIPKDDLVKYSTFEVSPAPLSNDISPRDILGNQMDDRYLYGGLIKSDLLELLFN